MAAYVSRSPNPTTPRDSAPKGANWSATRRNTDSKARAGSYAGDFAEEWSLMWVAADSERSLPLVASYAPSALPTTVTLTISYCGTTPANKLGSAGNMFDYCAKHA